MKNDQNDRPGAPTPKEAGGGDESSRELPTRGLNSQTGDEDIQEETVEMLNGILHGDDSTPRGESGKIQM